MARSPRHIQSTKKNKSFPPLCQSFPEKGEVIIHYPLSIIHYPLMNGCIVLHKDEVIAISSSQVIDNALIIKSYLVIEPKFRTSECSRKKGVRSQEEIIVVNRSKQLTQYLCFKFS